MGDRKYTIKLVKSLLKDKKRRKLYTDEELQYMQMQLVRLKLQRAAKKLQRKKSKGFG